MKNLPMNAGGVGKRVIASENAQPTHGHGRTETQAIPTTSGAQRSLRRKLYYQLFQRTHHTSGIQEKKMELSKFAIFKINFSSSHQLNGLCLKDCKSHNAPLAGQCRLLIYSLSWNTCEWKVFHSKHLSRERETNKDSSHGTTKEATGFQPDGPTSQQQTNIKNKY